jgi:putative endonuclease
VNPTASGQTSTVHRGARAEAAGQRYLESRGLKLVIRNFRSRGGEIDLVMLDGTTLVMVEVRYRARPDPVHPGETVTMTKRRRILRAASWFLATQPRLCDHALRFDVLAVYGHLDTPRCDWIRDAFSADDVGAL